MGIHRGPARDHQPRMAALVGAEQRFADRRPHTL
jgi:hypothetical protein